LGTVGFASTQTWVVGAQTWSAVVVATSCNKGSFTAVTTAPYTADCRKNPGFVGDVGNMFTWCMVVRYASQLCPDPWRVPLRADFVELSIARGGTGTWQNGVDGLNMYATTVWGGTQAGAGTGGSVINYASSGIFYGSDEYSPPNGSVLSYDSTTSSST